MEGEELDEGLVEQARRARQWAHAPYSGFPVGAAVRRRDGRVFLGANIENASYGLTCCAERVALFKAVTEPPESRPMTALAVSCGSPGQAPAAAQRMPCGACLQVMAELMDPEARVSVDGVGLFRLRDLLPQPFSLDG